MSGCFGCAAWARAHASGRGGLVARFRSNPSGSGLCGRSAALRRLWIARLSTAHRALHPIAQRPLRDPWEIVNRLLKRSAPEAHARRALPRARPRWAAAQLEWPRCGAENSAIQASVRSGPMRADSLRTVLPTKSAMQPSALSAQPASSSMSRRRGLLSTSTPSPPPNQGNRI